MPAIRVRALALALLTLLPTQMGRAEDWPAVREINLEIAPGSPLDFSAILPNGSLGPDRHLRIANGRFVFRDQPDVPAGLHCASLAWSPASGAFPDHDEADRYAVQLARHGYNLARFHFVEATLMAGRDGDFDLDPNMLDRLHYLLAALKREGISWVMDGLTSARGGLGGYDDRFDGVGSLKQDILLSEAGMEHWQRLQEKILGAVNPYTGLAPVQDPALALVVLVNEGGLEFDNIVAEGRGEPAYSELLRERFNLWLAERYADSAALAKAWGGLWPGESLEAGTIGLALNRWGSDARFPDLQRFFVEIEQAGVVSMSAHLRAMGYEGAITNYNNWPILQASVSRAQLDAVAMNIYFDWVSSYAPGTAIEQASSIGRELDYVRLAAGTRWLGKPFLLTEYDHLFWNSHRYEAGLAVPAIAAFQGWDAICRHGHGPIVLRYGEDQPHKQHMLPYAIALDPIARAGETLAALLFRRGDVSPAQSRVGLPIDVDARFGTAINQREAEGATALAAFTGIGLVEGDGEAHSLPLNREGVSAGDFIAGLAHEGAIAPEQVDLAGQGIFRSDTGEITIMPDKGLMHVVTARTVAAAFDTLDEPLRLGPVEIGDASSPALIALAALDDKSLAESDRILVIFASDAHNTGMRFADAEEKVIEDYGRLPVRIRPASLELTFEGEGAWSLSPMGLDGVVHQPLASGDGRLHWRLENLVPDVGPTVYFVIERD
ncbi:glycoside hydrolase [Devosia sp. SD17-2]|uniref:glycoside hydrolase n=1 Tax=Devosia sp. SD17-2 TaxID=2976459 RepID=UPI0023D8AD18|nr:glycoside hydrolase [Devosia sp. SD17-2]WEJ33624.1 glycoside hydrolase [Devosia sp. SD17-2]